MMLTKTNICSAQHYLRGNTDPLLFEKDKQNVDVASIENFLRTPMNDRAFSLSFFRYIRAFAHYDLFISFHSSCYYFNEITCNNKCYIQITMGVVDYSKRQLKAVWFPI